MIKLNKLVCLFLLFSQLIYAGVINENTTNNIKVLTELELTSLIDKTETLRHIDIEKYKNNIISLNQYSSQFTPIQYCNFKLLQIYNLAFIGDFEVAKSELIKLFNQCDKISTKVKIKSVLANLQVISHEYDESINNLDYAISHLNQIKEKKLKLSVYSVSALVYRLINQYELSLKFSQLILNNNPNNNYSCDANNNINRIKVNTNQADIKDSDIIESIEQCEEIGEFLDSNMLRLDWFKYKLDKYKDDKESIQDILSQLEKHNDQIDNTGYANLISIKNSIFALIYYELDQNTKMLEHANLVLNENKKTGVTKQKIDVLSLLVEHYKKIGDNDLAFKYLEEKNYSQEDLMNDKQAKIMAYQNVKHNNLAKTHEIEHLNHENNLLALENTVNHKTSIIQQLIISLLVALFSFVVFWIIRVKKTQAMYKHMSETDGMTNIYNRKGLKDYIEEMLASAKKGDRSIAYAIFDLDYFKKINDLYGHIKGDWVIKNTIKQCQLIQSDKVTFGRIGGEEFAIVMRDSSSDELAEFCEECRKLIANIDSSPTGYDFSVSASFGVTSTTISGYVYSDLMTDADKAMYDAKTAGRNMVVNFQNNKIN
jgi:diguanylate cyclase (GGDEF)-like protein